MCERQDEFREANTRVIIISFGTLPAIQDWMRETCVTYEVLLDRSRDVYNAYQLERSLLRSWHPRALWIYVKRWLKGETFHDSHGDDTTQLGGDFIIDKNGILRLVYASKDPTDRPTVDSLLAIFQKIG